MLDDGISGGGHEPSVSTPVDRLTALLYDDLSRLAHGKLRQERRDHTLDTVALVNEAYLRMADHTRVEWQSRGHFMAVAALCMRRILVDHAKARKAERRGGGNAVHVTLEGDLVADEAGAMDAVDLLELEKSLTRLEGFNPRGARVVEYRFFAGMSHEEVAEVMGLSVPTVRRAWTVARAWLASELV